MTGEYAEADWAWHNPISNGGNAAHQWRTLSIAEWDYLLNTRTNASAKWGTGFINGVGGLIILPDNWTLPSGCSFTSGTVPFDSDWTTHNSYTLSQWAQMESAGAVFLPQAGCLYFGPSLFAGQDGYYWSTTPYSEVSVEILHFVPPYVNTGGMPRHERYSVRPVQDEE